MKQVGGTTWIVRLIFDKVVKVNFGAGSNVGGCGENNHKLITESARMV